LLASEWLQFVFAVDTSNHITAVSVSTIAKGSTPELTFTGATPAFTSYIGVAASSGGCGSPSSTFQYTSAPDTIAAIGVADTYVLCYSIDGGLTYTEQTTFGDAFSVAGTCVLRVAVGVLR
jgi:hypothetical protein